MIGSQIDFNSVNYSSYYSFSPFPFLSNHSYASLTASLILVLSSSASLVANFSLSSI